MLILNSLPLLASSDDCPDRFHFDYFTSNLPECHLDLSFLVPTNDTNFNLQQLLVYYSLIPNTMPESNPDYWEISYPCFSNNKENSLFFSELVDSKSLPADEAEQLKKMRQQLLQFCLQPKEIIGNNIFLKELGQLKISTKTTPLVQYLKGAFYLYTDSADLAIGEFAKLAKTEDPKLKEIGLYLLARSQLIAAQKNWTLFSSDHKDLNENLLKEAEQNFNAYIYSYPNGRWTSSAKGLLRRSSFLLANSNPHSNSFKKYIELLTEAFNAALKAKDSEKIIFLGNEFGSSAYRWKTENIPWNSPLVAAMMVFYFNRLANIEGKTVFIEEDLRKFKLAIENYRNYPKLYELVGQQINLGMAKYSESIKGVNTNNQPNTTLNNLIEASMLLTVYNAYERNKQFAEARELLTRLWQNSKNATDNKYTKPRLEVLLARNYLLNNEFNNYFSKANQSANTYLFQIILEHLTDEIQIEQILKDSQVSDEAKITAESVQLIRYLMQRNYNAWENLYRKSHKETQTEFAAIETAVKNLARNDKDEKALLNLGFFLQSKGIRKGCFSKFSCIGSGWLVDQFPNAKLKIQASLIKAESPLKIYRQALQLLSRKDSDNKDPDLEPKIIYHFLKCFKGGGDNCWWDYDEKDAIPESERAQLFKKLKKNFSNSVWSKKLTLYW
jgi:hypothetical protein